MHAFQLLRPVCPIVGYPDEAYTYTAPSKTSTSRLEFLCMINAHSVHVQANLWSKNTVPFKKQKPPRSELSSTDNILFSVEAPRDQKSPTSSEVEYGVQVHE